MKRLFIIVCVALACGGCSITFQNAIVSHDFSKDNIDKRILEEDYNFVRMVTGEASASYVFWIGGLSERAKNIFSYSYQDMVKKANLQPNQAIVNVTAEKRVNFFFYPIFSKQVVHTSGMIVEFVKKKGASTITNTADKTCQTYKIGDLYVNGNIKGVVVSVSEDGKHGKIVLLKQTKNICWSTIQEKLGTNNSEYGKNNCEFIADYSNYPAIGWCANKGGYLPSLGEMQNLYKNIDAINDSLKKNGGDEILPFEQYWTSTEHDIKQAIAVQSTYYSLMDKASYLRVIVMVEF